MYLSFMLTFSNSGDYKLWQFWQSFFVPTPTPYAPQLGFQRSYFIRPQRFSVQSTPNHIELAPNRVETAVILLFLTLSVRLVFGLSQKPIAKGQEPLLLYLFFAPCCNREKGHVHRQTRCGIAALGCDLRVAFFTLGMMYSENRLSDFTCPGVEF